MGTLGNCAGLTEASLSLGPPTEVEEEGEGGTLPSVMDRRCWEMGGAEGKGPDVSGAGPEGT